MVSTYPSIVARRARITAMLAEQTRDNEPDIVEPQAKSTDIPPDWEASADIPGISIPPDTSMPHFGSMDTSKQLSIIISC